MKSRFLALALALLFLAAPAHRAAASEALPAELPAFSLKTLDGAPFDLASRKGQPLTAVIFFATWNPKSAAALAAVEHSLKAHAENGFAAVAVNAESETVAPDFSTQLAKYVAENNLTLPVVFDEGLVVYRGWDVKAMPTLFVLDAELKPIHSFAGAPTGFDAIFEEYVAEALGLKTKEESVAAEDHGGRYRPDRSIFLLYGMAQKLAERGRDSKALAKVEEAIAADAAFPDAHALKGALLLSEKSAEKNEASRASFVKAGELDATLPLCLFGRAHFALVDGDVRGAIGYARLALEQKNWGLMPMPDEETLAEALQGLDDADAKFAAKDLEGAKADVAKVLDTFLVLREKPKVKMRQLDQAAGK